MARIALLVIKGRNEDKVKFAIDHLRKEIDARTAGWKDLMVSGPAPSPLLRAESYYRYQIMLRTRAMSRLAAELAKIQTEVPLPEDTTLTIDVDAVNLS